MSKFKFFTTWIAVSTIVYIAYWSLVTFLTFDLTIPGTTPLDRFLMLIAAVIGFSTTLKVEESQYD